jgi:TonB family protein
MARSLLLVLALASAGTAMAASAQRDAPVEKLTRTGKWVANYDRDSCTVVAPMGEGRDGVAVKFTRYTPGEQFTLSVVGNRFAERDVRVEGTADFGAAPEPLKARAFAGEAGKYPALFFDPMRIDGWHPRQFGETGPSISPEREGQVTGVTLALYGKKPLRLEFGPLAAPMTVMHQCMDALVKRWGYDPAQQAMAQRHVSPATRPQSWLALDDYPNKAMRKGHNGIVQFRLDVDADGKVVGCFVLARTNPDDFADLTCRAITKRAKFEPALDAQGKPMRAFWVGSINWIA